VFLWTKKNVLVLFREPPRQYPFSQGHFIDAPYLNVHGEPERDLSRYLLLTVVSGFLTFRNAQQQFLSQERYDRSVRKALLKHTIETGIARKLESIYDAGVNGLEKTGLICRDGKRYKQEVFRVCAEEDRYNRGVSEDRICITLGLSREILITGCIRLPTQLSRKCRLRTTERDRSTLNRVNAVNLSTDQQREIYKVGGSVEEPLSFMPRTC
jgi:hypothetical protein